MFEPNPEQISFLIKMYEMYANTNISLGKISDYLNENNIPAPNGGRWDSNKVSRILHNPVYVRAMPMFTNTIKIEVVLLVMIYRILLVQMVAICLEKEKPTKGNILKLKITF